MTALTEQKTTNGTGKIGRLDIAATGHLGVKPNPVQNVAAGIDPDLRGNADFLFLKLTDGGTRRK